MLSASLKLLLRQVQASCRRTEEVLLAFGADRRCALKLDSVADRLLLMAGRIEALRVRMAAVGMQEAMDADCALRDSLKGLKDDIRVIGCQLASMDGPGLSARLQRAFQRLRKVAEETYAEADRFQWEITDHDARFQEAPADTSR